MFLNIIKAFKQTFSHKNAWFFWFLISFLFFALFILVPVWTTPDNDIQFQLSILRADVLFLMIFLSVLNGLIITLHRQVRIITKKNNLNLKSAGSGLGALVGSLMATVGCASCYSGLLALFGLGSAVFIVEHRWWIALIAVILSFFAIEAVAKRIVEGCDKCKIAL